MTQQTNLQIAKEEAYKKFDVDSEDTHGIDGEMGYRLKEYVDEIVTSTYLQAVEECVTTLEYERDKYPSSHGGNEKPRYYYDEAIQSLQFLKQTKDS